MPAPESRPKWQLERGERYGNLRRQEAELKVRERRNQRAKDRVSAIREVQRELQCFA